MKEIFSRRSIRKYQDKPIEDELIKKLLRAAICMHLQQEMKSHGNLL